MQRRDLMELNLRCRHEIYQWTELKEQWEKCCHLSSYAMVLPEL